MTKEYEINILLQNAKTDEATAVQTLVNRMLDTEDSRQDCWFVLMENHILSMVLTHVLETEEPENRNIDTVIKSLAQIQEILDNPKLSDDYKWGEIDGIMLKPYASELSPEMSQYLNVCKLGPSKTLIATLGTLQSKLHQHKIMLNLHNR